MTNRSNLRFAFTPDSTPKRGKKGVTNVSFVYVKRVKAKVGVTSHLSVPRVRNNQMQAIVSVALPLTATPKRGTKHTFIFVKAPRLNAMSYHTLGFLKCGMTNAINYKCGFPRDSNPKRGNTSDIYKLAHTRRRRPQDTIDNIYLNDNKCNTLAEDGDIKKRLTGYSSRYT